MTLNKLKILIPAAILFCSTLLLGQTNKFDIGLEGGPGLTFIRGNELIDEYNATIGYSAGVAFQYNFPKMISIRTNLAFERKGSTRKFPAKDQDNNTIGKITFNTNFNYLTIPVLARITFGRKIKLFINIGPYFGYLIKQTEVMEAFNEFPETTTNNTENDKRFDVGITGGIGGGIAIHERILLTLEIRNNLGLYNISKIPVYNDGSVKTNSTNLLVGIVYHLGEKDID